MDEWVSPQTGARVVLPPGRKVFHSFVDGTTGYEVVAHHGVSETDGLPHIILVDPRSGEVVPRERRAAEISSDERVRIDEAHGLRLATRHTIDMETGQETLDEVLTDVATGAVLMGGRSMGLRPAGAKDALESHLEWRAQEEAFSREYAGWSFDQRVIHWYDQMRRSMRSQEEFGLDEYAMFTPESYATWRAREPDIDRIFDAAVARFESPGKRAEILRRVGRASPRAKRR